MEAGSTTESTVSLSKLNASFSMEDLIFALKPPGFIWICNCLEFAWLHGPQKVVGTSSPLCKPWVSTLVQLTCQHPLFVEKNDPSRPISARARANLEQNPMAFTVIFFFQLPRLFVLWSCWHCSDSSLFLCRRRKLSVCWEVQLQPVFGSLYWQPNCNSSWNEALFFS